MQSNKRVQKHTPSQVWPKAEEEHKGGGGRNDMNHRFGLWIATATMAVVGVTGCATKNWVKTQTAPINDHTGQLEDKTAANGRAIHDTDERAQAGVKQAMAAADTATQN